MAAIGPIILIEPNTKDQRSFIETMDKLHVENQVLIFETCKSAMSHLCTTKDHPFLIVCEINLPLENGLVFKKEIDENPFLRRKSIPFIFYTDKIDQKDINTAYAEMTTQGYFQKCNTETDTTIQWRTIIEYWRNCYHPNT